MSFAASHMISTSDWQDWLSGRTAFDLNEGHVVSLDECERAWRKVYEYLRKWGMETDACWLAYQTSMVRRSDMTEVGTVSRSECYDGQSSGLATRYELADEPGGAITVFACDLGNGTVELWFDTYGV